MKQKMFLKLLYVFILAVLSIAIIISIYIFNQELLCQIKQLSVSKANGKSVLDRILIVDLKKDFKLDNYSYEKLNNNVINSFKNESFIFDINKHLTQLYYKNKFTNDEDLWYIEIPKINLKANIAEGTTQSVLNSYVGHFSDSGTLDGNVCLAAHNRGYNVNYFANIKELEYDDELYYCYEGIKNCYVVNNITIIDETDWSLLEQNGEDLITLITCVEDAPNLRRCIQGIKFE